ncbi:hypothetical protein, partial [Neoroseomonas rubea]|uniref:hypothetical protein n=1 Tax=Neoroseomonas rubea TaxID=2748666 RepID=UPI001E46A6C6
MQIITLAEGEVTAMAVRFKGATVAHCPTPFARYGEHLKHFGKYRARGVNMGFGTDCAPHNL